MPETQYKICPRCKARAALAAPHCLVCGRKYNTQFTPPPEEMTQAFLAQPPTAAPSLLPQTPTPSFTDTTPANPSNSPLGNMATVGFRLIVLGVLIASYFFFLFDTTVPVGNEGQNILNVERVHNIGLMQKQTLGLVCGAAIGIIGTIFTAVGYSKGEKIDWRGVLFGKNGMVLGGVAAVLLLIIGVLLISSSPDKKSPASDDKSSTDGSTRKESPLEMERRFHAYPTPTYAPARSFVPSDSNTHSSTF